MSGGRAYVLGAPRIASDMLDVEPIDDEDDERVRGLLGEHVQLTRSARASEILREGRTYRTRVVRIMPGEYKNVLGRRALRVV